MNLKQKLSKKLKKTGGFTLIEMLIVVAIIAILIAVSIPLVSGALDKARKATDAANERAAKAAAVIEYMTGDITFTGDPASAEFYYDATAGDLKDHATAPTDQKYGQCSEHKGDYLVVTITEDGDATVAWSEGEPLDSDALISGDSDT